MLSGEEDPETKCLENVRPCKDEYHTWTLHPCEISQFSGNHFKITNEPHSKPKLVGSDYLTTTHDQRTLAEQESVNPICWNSELKSKLEIHAAQSGAVSSRRRTKSDPLTERRTSDPRSSLPRSPAARGGRNSADGRWHTPRRHAAGEKEPFLTERDKNRGKSVASSHNELLTLNEIWWSFKNTSTL